MSLAPEYIWMKGTTMVDKSTLNLTVILHGTTQTRCIILSKATDNALITLNNISWPFFRSFTIVSLQCCPESTARITTPIRGENKDLTPTNQNTRSRTRQHPISCILVPRHDHAHVNHFCRLKSPNHQIFTDLDPFYHPHFAFHIGLPAVPYRRGRPNVQNTISSTKNPLNPSSRLHPSFRVTTTATPQGPHRI